MKIRNCTKKKSEYRIHEILSNGQHLNIYIERLYTKTIDHLSEWHVSVIISNNRKEANLWYKNKKNVSSVTGRCGIEGLLKALEHIIYFKNNMMGDALIVVEWDNPKKKRAYKRLLNYGFVLYEDAYIGANDNYRYWKGDS